MWRKLLNKNINQKVSQIYSKEFIKNILSKKYTEIYIIISMDRAIFIFSYRSIYIWYIVLISVLDKLFYMQSITWISFPIHHLEILTVFPPLPTFLISHSSNCCGQSSTLPSNTPGTKGQGLGRFTKRKFFRVLSKFRWFSVFRISFPSWINSWFL